MQLTLESHGELVIQSWEPGRLRINDKTIDRHCIVHADRAEFWQPPAPEAPAVADFVALIELQPEVILFGTGAEQRFPAITVVTEIMQQGIAFEVMDTGAACRTFNILNGEQRRVVAALLVD